MPHLGLVPFPGHEPLAVVGMTTSEAEVICTLHVTDSESNSGQEGDLELGASAPSGSSSKLDSTLKSDLKCARGHSYFEDFPRMGISQCLLSLMQEVGYSHCENLFCQLRDSPAAASFM